jgi:predicted dehydrogenase
MKKNLNAAVVGVGYLGRFHAQKYKFLSEQPGANVKLIGVCDGSAERADEIARELGVTAYTNPKDLIGKVDCVTIAATTSAHYELCKLFLSAGVHVHVEKPITATAQEAEEICRLAESKNLKLQVGHIERFNPALIAASAKIKKPLFIECNRLAAFKPRGADVSVVHDLMIHDLDLILHLVQSEPIAVHANGTKVLTKTHDIVNARIEFKSGAVANVTSSRVSLKAERKFRLFQENQYFSMDFGSGEIRLLTKTGEFTDPDNLPIESESWNLEKSDALLAETKSFVDCIANDKPCVVTGRDGLKALKLAEDILDVIERRGR